MKNAIDELPDGWDDERVRGVLEHYERQADEEALAEDEAAFGSVRTTMQVPAPLVPDVQRLIERYELEKKAS